MGHNETKVKTRVPQLGKKIKGRQGKEWKKNDDVSREEIRLRTKSGMDGMRGPACLLLNSISDFFLTSRFDDQKREKSSSSNINCLVVSWVTHFLAYSISNPMKWRIENHVRNFWSKFAITNKVRRL